MFRLNASPSDEIILGLTRDMDGSGISMYTMYSLTEGQVVILEGESAKANQRATVMWVENYGHYYEARLKLETAPSAPTGQ
jgi:hypothetical protein